MPNSSHVYKLGLGWNMSCHARHRCGVVRLSRRDLDAFERSGRDSWIPEASDINESRPALDLAWWRDCAFLRCRRIAEAVPWPQSAISRWLRSFAAGEWWFFHVSQA